MKFSICIPNYNYAHYLDKTIASALAQTYGEFEIVVADNASTDASISVIESFGDPRIRIRVNPCNVGFAGNLDRAASMATGDRLIMLSSDDLMGPAALETYDQLLKLLPSGGERAVISSAEYLVDSEGAITDTLPVYGPPFLLPSDRVPDLEAKVGAPVYRVAAGELLRRCVLEMQNPFHFVTTCYSRALYEQIGGYGGGRLYNPDKWFHWRLLAAAEEAYYIDLPLFSYRWHSTNQAALQKQSGALKYLVDEYLNSFELTNDALQKAGLTRAEVEAAFVERDVARHGWAVLAKRNAYEARRILRYGQSVYPQVTRRNRKARLLSLALPFGPLAHRLARYAYRSRLEEHANFIQPAAPRGATAAARA